MGLQGTGVVADGRPPRIEPVGGVDETWVQVGMRIAAAEPVGHEGAHLEQGGFVSVGQVVHPVIDGVDAGDALGTPMEQVAETGGLRRRLADPHREAVTAPRARWWSVGRISSSQACLGRRTVAAATWRMMAPCRSCPALAAPRPPIAVTANASSPPLPVRLSIRPWAASVSWRVVNIVKCGSGNGRLRRHVRLRGTPRRCRARAEWKRERCPSARPRRRSSGARRHHVLRTRFLHSSQLLYSKDSPWCRPRSRRPGRH